MPNRITIDHQEIKSWIETHHGRPAIIDDPEAKNDKIGLRVDFPGKEDEAFLTHSHRSIVVGWDRFFQIFDNQQLAFVIIDDPGVTNQTWEYRFIPRESVIIEPNNELKDIE